MNLKSLIPENWLTVLESATESPTFQKLNQFLEEEEKEHQIFPDRHEIFSAFRYCKYHDVNVVILGQDPYHGENQAHGLAFSVLPGVKHPPSLRNILKELSEDVGTTTPDSGFLSHWAKQGVLMINAVMTVRAHQANSHKGKGWEAFTDEVIKTLSRRVDPVIFILWGSYAQKKKQLIDCERNYIIESAHPSPLSAYRGFFGSRPFSRINKILEENGKAEVNWQLPSSMLL
jgi:uracil-DNA glycosylase